MAIPLTYNLRNLVVRKTTTLMTALGIALTVAVLLAMMALLTGLRATLSASGDPLQIIVMRKGSESELVSNFTRGQFQDLKFKAGIARAQNGDPMASLEVVTVINLASVDAPEGANVTLRGLSPIGIEMRPSLKISAGRWFETGKREVVVGKSIAKRYPGAALGKRLTFGRGQASHVWPRRLGSGRRHGRRPDRPKQRDFRRPQPGQFRPATRRRAELGPGAGHRCRRGRRIAEQHQ